MKISDALPIIDKTLHDMRVLSIKDDIDENFSLYWTVPADASFDMKTKPVELDIGNIQEEYESIMRRMADGGMIVPDSFMFLSALFKLAYDLSGHHDVK